MKKVVIVTRQMVMGGVEKALISMLKEMPKNQYDVTVLVMANGGELVSEIPDHIKVECLYGNEKNFKNKIFSLVKRGEFISAYRNILYTILGRRANSVFEEEMFHSKFMPKLRGYDIAIAYHMPASFPVIYTIQNIEAKKKIAWIHSDVSQHVKELQPYSKYFDSFDKVFCVSKDGLNKFVGMYPQLREKAEIFYNIIDEENLRKMAVSESFCDGFKGIRILTVGRLTSQKGQDIIPEILCDLIKKGYNVRWYCIGDGEDKHLLINKIKEHNLENYFILLGTKCNPYPYFKDCDIYVQPSRYEGYCITLAEARIFHKPIIATDFVGAREQIENREDGYIVDFSAHELSNAVKTLVDNEEIRNGFTRSLKSKNVDTRAEILKLNDI